MKKVLILIIVLIIIVCIGCGVFYKNKELPKKVLEEYIVNINEENYDKMYDMITKNAKSNISKEDFINRNKNIYSRNRYV